MALETETTTDEELLRLHQRGDRAAFVALVRRWEGPLGRTAARVLGGVREAEDVRQAFFLKLWESPLCVKSPASFAAWARRAIVNAAVSAARKRLRHDRALARRGPPDEPAPLMETEESNGLALALAQLPPKDRALLALRYDEGLTFAEIGGALGAPPSTIKSRHAQAIARLRSLMKEGPAT